MKSVRDGGAALRTVHHYTRAIEQFSRWLWRDGRTRDEDLLSHLTSQNADQDRRRERRALFAAEQARLIRAAERGGVVSSLDGRGRAMLDRIALGTGSRADEIRTLTPRAFRLDDSPPTALVAAACSGRRRDAPQPIRPELADSLRPRLAARPADGAIFGLLSKHTNVMVRTDLAAAGIPERDGSGRVVDFRALRHSL